MEKSEKVIASCRNKGVSSLHKPLSLFFIQNALEVMLLCPVIGWGAWISKLWDANKGLPRDCRAAGSKPARQDGPRAAPLPDSAPTAQMKERDPVSSSVPLASGCRGPGRAHWVMPSITPNGTGFMHNCILLRLQTKMAISDLIGGGKGKSCFHLYGDKGLTNCSFLLDP